MKKKELTKKFDLNKVTIAYLEADQLDRARGGALPMTCPTTCTAPGYEC